MIGEGLELWIVARIIFQANQMLGGSNTLSEARYTLARWQYLRLAVLE